MKTNIALQFDHKQREMIASWIKNALSKVETLALDTNLTLTIKPIALEKEFAQLHGITGYCPSAKTIRLGLDFTYPKFDQLKFALTLVHELHHAHREYMGIKTSQATLKETMIEEGLADLYCQKILGQRPVWSINLSKSERKRLLTLATPDFEKPTSDKLYTKWFLKGSPKDTIPRWAGYALGYYLATTLL